MTKNKIRLPKISIITPVYNQVNFIEQTILSVINQDYDNIEYIIIDGGSTDGTIDVIRKYEEKIAYWISEPDLGMYNAINKGFKVSSGEIMGWINSDDILLPRALFNMQRLFNDLGKVEWIQGLNNFIDLNGELINTNIGTKFSFIKFLNGDFKWIQQESTFWRKSLWEKAGSRVNEELKLAGDFELWFRFFQFAKLYNSNLQIGAWRKREGQLSGVQRDKYLKEVVDVVLSYIPSVEINKKLKKLKRIEFYIKLIRKFKVLNINFFIKQRIKYLDLKNIEIYYSHQKNKFFVK